MAELTVEAYRNLVYSKAWQAYRDPEIPEWIDPVWQILERHLGTAVESKPAICSRACSTSARARVPSKATLDGLPNASRRAHSIASITSGWSGVVALWSR